MEERFLLVMERIAEIKNNPCVNESFVDYFQKTAELIENMLVLAEANISENQNERESCEKVQELYQGITPSYYEESYANPAYAVQILGKEMGQICAFLVAEIYAVIPSICGILHEKEDHIFEITIRAELYVEIYCSFEVAYTENKSTPKSEEMKEIIYWFISDYMEPETEGRTRRRLNPEYDMAYRIVMESDLSKTDYLYSYGQFITSNQIETAKYLAEMPEENVQLMADTYTEGYRIGFIKANIDLSKKKIVNIIYPIGFERMIKLAIDNFELMGLQPTMQPHSQSVFHKRGTAVNGYFGESPNKQFDFDHKDDEALVLDKKFINRRLEIIKETYEGMKELAAVHAGPAVVEVFGEEPFAPKAKEENLKLSGKQQELSVLFYGKSGQIINEYIKGEERSFTIIAFPIPEIGKAYQEIMAETIKLNTLDYITYEKVQQVMIDALDQAEHVIIKGMNGNRTDLKVMLCNLNQKDKETKFENCVADVNIPVGEIFTSPVLKGTDGILHVSSVYLKGLEYKELSMVFENGMITEYDCSNFNTQEQNKAYMKENILCHHDSLPMGEFAIGTNTIAYMMGKQFDIANKLPILIAEKTGPHFAVGDTCYSHSEEVAVFNSDGKEIIARDNEISALRKEDIDKAYFQCHTDITIPYDELGELYGMKEDGQKISIIENGRFVLKGTELLNEAFTGHGN